MLRTLPKNVDEKMLATFLKNVDKKYWQQFQKIILKIKKTKCVQVLGT
jgi:hypothetical protein